MTDKDYELAHDHDCDCSDEGCDCGHDHDHDHGHHHHHHMITLTLDDDTELECAVLGIFDVEDKEYIALLPEEGDDVFIYLYNELEDGSIDLQNIDTEEEFEKVAQVFNSLIEEEEEEEEVEE